MRAFFSDFWNYDRRETVKIIFWTIVSSLTAGIGVVMLVPMLAVLDISQDDSSAFSWLYSVLAGIPKLTVVLLLLAIYILLVSAKAFITAKLSVWTTKLVAEYYRHMRLRLYDAITLADWQRYKAHKKTDFLNYMTTEIGRVSAAEYYLVDLAALVITAVVNIGIALWMNVPMTILVCVLGIAAFMVFRKIHKHSEKCGLQLQKADERVLEEVTNQMNGVKEFRSYGVIKKQRDIYWQAEEEELQTGVRYAKLMAGPQLLLSIGSAVLIAGLFLLAYFGLGMSIARIAVLIYVFARLWPCVSSGQNYLQQIHAVMPVYNNLISIIDELRDGTVQASDSDEEVEFEKEMRFHNVSFRYNDSSQNEEILKDLSFSIKRGEITALVGRSGAGKSTLVDLILGFLKPTDGYITIDDKVVASASAGSADATGVMHLKVSYIPQEPLLLNASVRDNITRFHSSMTDEELRAALEAAQILEVVEKLPLGVDTVIGDQGIRLSGGERQRIVLARALAERPQLLIMDEATSALDYENEKKIRDILMTLKSQLTVVLIAHRISTIQSADHILVLEDGILAEEGTYAELTHSGESYLAGME